MTSEPAQNLAKTFDPAALEAKWYAHWEEQGCFRPARPDAEPFTIVNPPPNVTGSLHVGHALDNTLQDIVIRYERLRGKDALWWSAPITPASPRRWWWSATSPARA